jgi:hypothetical protein
VSFFPRVQTLLHFRPILKFRRSAATSDTEHQQVDSAERLIMDSARFRLRQLGLPVTEASLRAEAEEMGRLYEKYC